MTNTKEQHPSAQSRWIAFVRAFSEEIDLVYKLDARDAILRRVGVRMAGELPIAPVTTLDALEHEVNETLEYIGWGRAVFDLDEASRILKIAHEQLPTIDTPRPNGSLWLSAVLEGLYTGWISQQPMANALFQARRSELKTDGTVILVYGRVDRISRPPPEDVSLSAHRRE